MKEVSLKPMWLSRRCWPKRAMRALDTTVSTEDRRAAVSWLQLQSLEQTAKTLEMLLQPDQPPLLRRAVLGDDRSAR